MEGQEEKTEECLGAGTHGPAKKAGTGTAIRVR